MIRTNRRSGCQGWRGRVYLIPCIPYSPDTLSSGSPTYPKKDMGPGTWKELGTRNTLPWKGDGTRSLEGTKNQRYPSPGEQTNTCENITFPQLHWWSVIMQADYTRKHSSRMPQWPRGQVEGIPYPWIPYPRHPTPGYPTPFRIPTPNTYSLNTLSPGYLPLEILTPRYPPPKRTLDQGP